MRFVWGVRPSASRSIQAPPIATRCMSSCGPSPKKPKSAASPSSSGHIPGVRRSARKGRLRSTSWRTQLGAHVIKVKLPSAHLEQAAAKKVYEATQIPIKTLAERVKHVVQSAFDGRRIVIFSGGA